MQPPSDDPGFSVLNELANEIPQMALAFALICVPVLVVWLSSVVVLEHHFHKSSRPEWRHRPARYSGFDVFLLLWLAFMVLPAMVRLLCENTGLFHRWNLHSDSEQARTVNLITAPLWFATLFGWRYAFANGSIWKWNEADIITHVSYGCRGFLLLTVPILAIYFFANTILILGGGTPEKHPLTQLQPESSLDVMLLIVSACVVAPIMEELVFRGILLSWCRERVHRSLFVFAMAAVVLLYFRGVAFLPAILLLLDLIALALLAAYGKQIWRKWPARTASAVASTSALFAVLHASVWPTPWPLLFFGIGLGIMTARSGSVLPAIITHALFNAVAVVFQLRGGA